VAGPPAAPDAKPDRVLRAIAVFKFCKVALATVVGLGALRLLEPSTAAWADRWLAALAERHDRRVVSRLIAAVLGLHPRGLQTLAFAAFLLAALFATEGVGLWLGKRWGPYLTVIATLVFVPLEVVQVARLVTPTRLGALLLNLVVVVLLVQYLMRRAALQRAGGQVTPP